MKRAYSQFAKSEPEEIITRKKIDSDKYEEVKIKKNNADNNHKVNLLASTPTSAVNFNSFPSKGMNLQKKNNILLNCEVKKLPSSFNYYNKPVPFNDIMSGLNKVDNKNLNSRNITGSSQIFSSNNNISQPKRNFSYSNLNTEMRSNFKNTFGEVIKNKNMINKCDTMMKKSFTPVNNNTSTINWSKINHPSSSPLINSTPNSKLKMRAEPEENYLTPKFNEITGNNKNFIKKTNNNIEPSYIPLKLKVNINKTSFKSNFI